MIKIYDLPPLACGYDGLKPFLSQDQLAIHHQKHHAAYINNANALIERIDAARLSGSFFDIKAAAKELSFNISGHKLHSIFWNSLKQSSGGSNEPQGELGDEIQRQFNGFETFKKEFSAAAVSCEGSGWAALAFCPEAKRLYIVQIEKHNVNPIANLNIIFALDVWEHAYYLDYKNDRAKYVQNFWPFASWNNAEVSLSRLLSE
jgi:Fe-Mn family superoxide dismutase